MIEDAHEKAGALCEENAPARMFAIEPIDYGAAGAVDVAVEDSPPPDSV